jgi:hypothetical protein
MRIIKSENIKPFDIDNTLILPIDPSKVSTGRIVDVYDAITKRFIRMQVHEPNVRLLIEEAHRGAYIIVWSRSGYEWAANVIRALDLVPQVNLVLSKPLVYFDDMDVSQWLKDRVYLTPETRYKK